MQALLFHLRSGDFVTAARARLWAGAVIAAVAAAMVFLLATAHGPNDYQGRPLGTDFSNVYAAGKAALAGHAAAPFDIVQQRVMEQQVFGPATQLYGWHYPPFFLLIAAGLANLPYLGALALWSAATLALYLMAMRLLLKSSVAPQLARGASWWLLSLGFPAVMVNLLHGQNGFLTAGLMALGLALLERKPVLSGIAFGLLCYKPQYYALIPLLLLAGGHVRALVASVLTVLVLAAAATALFGFEIWPAFLQGAHFTRTVVLEQGNTGFEKMQSVFALVRLWGGSVALAYGAQGVVALAALLSALRIWRGDTTLERRGVALCAAVLLITPYSLDYDLVVLAPMIALLSAQGARNGFGDWDLAIAMALWALPGFARPLAQHLAIPVIVPLLLLVLWRTAGQAPKMRLIPVKAASW